MRTDDEIINKLFNAIANNDLPTLKNTLEDNVINISDQWGHTPLIQAIWSDRLNIAKFLIQAGADVNKLDYCNKPTLHLASEKHDIELIKMLVSSGINIHAVDNRGETALFNAIEANDLDLVKYFVNIGLDVNKISGYGDTPLLRSVGKYRYVDADIISFLIASGANLELKNSSGNTALYEAVQWTKDDIVKVLVASGADTNTCNNYNRTPIMLLCHNDNLAVLKLLLKAGADINAINLSGDTFLHHIIKGKYITDLVKEAISSGADINIKNDCGDTPLHCAVSHRNKNSVVALIQNNSNINQINLNLETPLHIAGYYSNIGIMRILLKAGADLYAEDNRGNTALNNLRGSHAPKYDKYKDELIKLAEKQQLKRFNKEDCNKSLQTNYEFNL